MGVSDGETDVIAGGYARVFKEQETEAEPDGWERWRESVYKCSNAAQSVLVMTQLTPHIAANPSPSLASPSPSPPPASLPTLSSHLRLQLCDAGKDGGSNWSAGLRSTESPLQPASHHQRSSAVDVVDVAPD